MINENRNYHKFLITKAVFHLKYQNVLDAQSIKKKRKKAIKHFTEGWVEFESKKVAKFVAATLNNTQISMRKKSRFYDVMWNIKYLPR